MEDQELIEERSTRLMVALEGRAEALLEALHEARSQRATMVARLDELEHQRQALEARNAELIAEARERADERDTLAQQLTELQDRLADAEASGMELLEENRELDEQNRELESHNRQLRAERDDPGEHEVSPFFQRRGRRAQGFSALMGQRHKPFQEAGNADSEPAESEDQVPETADEPAAVVEGPSEQDQQETLPSIDEAPSPQALLEQWYQRYPEAFFKGHTRPLQVGIHEALTAREAWPEKLVRRALACYVNLPRYLKSVREGAERIDLDGAPGGQVDGGAAEHARKKLERLQSARRSSAKASRRATPRRSAGGGKVQQRDSRDPKEASNAGHQGGASDQTRETDSMKSSADTSSQAMSSAQADEPADSRMQRKLGELMARHNADGTSR
ncbi:ProQ/FINO family protein [Halomonas sabkhae]|uniref:ProQ/FINO family protein n=1 Tax=Halomonas sabkhae TaxID=626223 RepID=UPI0025B2AD2F|nr:ProQ/FINO family protein [Halomonas sabkhae]MDN3524293.1 ProQ/FINO family protein [Halomonas sabkhae]